MRCVAVVLALALVPACLATMDILNDELPVEVPRQITTVVFNRYLGPQKRFPIIQNATLSYWKAHHAPRHFTAEECNMYRDTVVVAESGRQWDMKHEERAAVAFQECGAVALLRSRERHFGGRTYIGIHIDSRDINCCRGSDVVEIPVLETWYEDFLDIGPMILEDDVVFKVNLAVDENKWRTEYHEDWGFITFFRIITPFVNGICTLYGIRSLYYQHIRQSVLTTPGRKFSMISLALLTDTLACAIRCIYCACGPFLMTPVLPFVAHHMMGNMSASLNLIVVGISVVMLQRVGALPGAILKLEGTTGARIGSLMVFMCIFGELLLGYFRSIRLPQYGALFTISAGLNAVFILVTSVIFIRHGYMYLKMLTSPLRCPNKGSAAMKVTLANVQCTRQRFIRMIMAGALAGLMTVFLLMTAVATPTKFYQPRFHASMFAMYTALFTISSICHIRAYSPPDDGRSPDAPRGSNIAQGQSHRHSSASIIAARVRSALPGNSFPIWNRHSNAEGSMKSKATAGAKRQSMAKENSAIAMFAIPSHELGEVPTDEVVV